MKRIWMALALAGLLDVPMAFAEGEAITLTPHSGFTAQVPKGWKACDEATDRALGTADDPLSLGKQVCPAGLKVEGIKLIVFRPQVGYTATVMFGYAEQSPITPEVMTSLTTEMLAQVRDGLKTEKEAELTKIGSRLDDIQVRIDKIAGQPALVSTILQTPKEGALAQVYTETWEIPYAGHLYQLSFVWPKLLESNTKPALDAIKATVKLEPAS